MDTIDETKLDEMIAALSLHDDEWPNRAELCLALIELRQLRRMSDRIKEHWMMRWFMRRFG